MIGAYQKPALGHDPACDGSYGQVCTCDYGPLRSQIGELTKDRDELLDMIQQAFHTLLWHRYQHPDLKRLVKSWDQYLVQRWQREERKEQGI